MCRGITSCSEIGDFDISGRKKFCQVKYDAGLIQANDINTIRNAVLLVVTGAGLLQIDGQALNTRQFVELLLKLCERVPVPGNQEEHGEFGAKGGHPAFLNIATTGEDSLADILHDTRTVTTNS